MQHDPSRRARLTNKPSKRGLGLAALSGGMVLVLAIAFALVGSAGARTARTAVAPSNTAPPTISGTTTQGQVLTASSGTWSGTTPITYSYEWQRCDSSGGSCSKISGATAATYTLVSPDVSNTVRVAVTATNGDGNSSATSVPTAVVQAATTKPVNTEPPTISGTVQAGQTLTATTGTWTGTDPITYQYQWQRCDTTGGSCGNEGGQTHATFVVQNPDIGSTVRVAVTATNTAGDRSATSVPTALVKAATVTPPPAPAPTGCATNGGTVAVAGITSPAHLNIDQFQVSPSTIAYSTRSLTARFHVSACGGSVQGALVYVTAVPYGMFAATNEQTTGADGWASVNLTALSGFPVSRHQQLLVMFVRARKSGEDILGGISARRLVSFKVARG